MFTPSVVLIASATVLDEFNNSPDAVVLTGDALDSPTRVYSVYVLDGEHAGSVLGAVGIVAESGGNAVYSYQPLMAEISGEGCRSLDEATDRLIAATIGTGTENA